MSKQIKISYYRQCCDEKLDLYPVEDNKKDIDELGKITYCTREGFIGEIYKCIHCGALWLKKQEWGKTGYPYNDGGWESNWIVVASELIAKKELEKLTRKAHAELPNLIDDDDKNKEKKIKKLENLIQKYNQKHKEAA